MESVKAELWESLTKQERLERVIDIAFGGKHHVGKIKREGEGYVRFTYHGDFSTWDWTVMTRLVLACCRYAVRAEVGPGGPRAVSVLLSCRKRSGAKTQTEGHPDIWAVLENYEPDFRERVCQLADAIRAEEGRPA